MKTLKTNLKNKKSISFFTSKVKLTLISACVAVMTLTSCGGSDDDSSAVNCGNASWLQSIETEAITWLTAMQEYEQDQTTENCQKNKSTAQAYINALEEVKSCVPNVDLADFEDAIGEAQDEVNATSCN